MEQRDLKKRLRNYFIINEAIHPVGLYIIIEFVLPTSQSWSLMQTSTVGNISKPKMADTTGAHSSECLSVCDEASMNWCMILGAFS